MILKFLYMFRQYQLLLQLRVIAEEYDRRL